MDKENQFDIVIDKLLASIRSFDGEVSAGIVAYALVVMGCQMSHDFCPEGEDWTDLIHTAIAQVMKNGDMLAQGEEDAGATVEHIKDFSTPEDCQDPKEVN